MTHHVPSESVLRDLPTAVVVVRIGSGEIVYQNAAAQRHAAVFQLGPASWLDEDGVPIEPERLPLAVAGLGEPLEREVYQLRLEPPRWFVVQIARVEGEGLAILTFADVTSVHETQEQLRRAIAARDELVSMASHELRSPIAALGLVAEQLGRKELPDAVTRLARMTLRQVRRLGMLVGNLLDVSRLRAGRFELDRERCKLADIVRDAREHLVDQAKNERVELTVEIETEATGLWDAVRMDQVIANLVNNAIKYGARTPVRLRLCPAGPSHVELSVEDGGPGVPEAERERIFTAYARADRRWKAQSLGLGLYIVSEIVQAHHGVVRLESQPGRTRFIVVLPIER